MSVDRPVDPPKSVEVRCRGTWVSGHLAAWRKVGDRWSGFVELQVLRGGSGSTRTKYDPADATGSGGRVCVRARLGLRAFACLRPADETSTLRTHMTNVTMSSTIATRSISGASATIVESSPAAENTPPTVRTPPTRATFADTGLLLGKRLA